MRSLAHTGSADGPDDVAGPLELDFAAPFRNGDRRAGTSRRTSVDGVAGAPRCAPVDGVAGSS